MSELTYKTAIEEIAAIARELENQSISIDELSEKVKRAQLLLEFCQQKLRATENDLKSVISGEEKNRGN